MTEKFKVGDKVKGLGMTGVVIKNSSFDQLTGLPLCVRFDNRLECCFLTDGRFFEEGEPCLELVERPKQKVKRTYYRAVTYYKDNALNYLYKTGYYATKELLMKENTNIVEIEEKEFEIEK